MRGECVSEAFSGATPASGPAGQNEPRRPAPQGNITLGIYPQQRRGLLIEGEVFAVDNTFYPFFFQSHIESDNESLDTKTVAAFAPKSLVFSAANPLAVDRALSIPFSFFARASPINRTIRDHQYTCYYCHKTFLTGRGLGGHVTKSHSLKGHLTLNKPKKTNKYI